MPDGQTDRRTDRQSDSLSSYRSQKYKFPPAADVITVRLAVAGYSFQLKHGHWHKCWKWLDIQLVARFNEAWCIKYRGRRPRTISSVWKTYLLHASDRVCQINKNPQILRIFGFLFIWQTLSSAFSRYIFQTSYIALWRRPLSINRKHKSKT